jgi:hypothetical protein
MSNSSPPTSATRIRAEPMPGHAPIFHLVRATRPHTSRDPAVRCRDIYRGPAAGALGTGRQGSNLRRADAVRLADYRPGASHQPGSGHAGAEACGENRQDRCSRAPNGASCSSPFRRRRSVICDRALIATLTYSFARISAALKMKVEDLPAARRRLDDPAPRERRQVARHAVPSRACRALRAYIDAAGITEDRKGWLFRTARGHNGSALSHKNMSQLDAQRMIRRRAAAAGIAAESAATPSAPPGLPPTSPTAARSSTRRKWRRTRAREPPSSTSARRSGLRRTK